MRYVMRVFPHDYRPDIERCAEYALPIVIVPKVKGHVQVHYLSIEHGKGFQGTFVK